MVIKFLYVYIIKCSDGLYYVGITNNLEKRIEEHNKGINEAAFTYYRRPVELKFRERFTNYVLAIEWETRVKKWSAKKKEALINSDWKSLKEFSECKNASIHTRDRK